MAIWQLLTTRASMDSCQKKLLSNIETAIKETKPFYIAAIWDAEAKCAAAIREAETTSADHTHILQWSPDGSIQDLECKAIEKEGQDHQSFLEVCGAALQVCPTEI